MSTLDFTSLLLSLRLAFISLIILLCIGLPLANWLAFSPKRFKIIIEALVAMPLVLPPTVLGFYLLVALNPDNFIGYWWFALTDSTLVFNFSGLVIGSVLYSLPFVVQPLQSAFSMINKHQLEAASTLGARPLDRFFSIKLPLIKKGFITACVLGFAHTLGEFGVVLMIGGNIPGKTQLISIDIYNKVALFQYGQANKLALILLIFSFIALIFLYGYQHVRYKSAL